jgi:hypothetical protein
MGWPMPDPALEFRERRRPQVRNVDNGLCREWPVPDHALASQERSNATIHADGLTAALQPKDREPLREMNVAQRRCARRSICAADAAQTPAWRKGTGKT